MSRENQKQLSDEQELALLLKLEKDDNNDPVICAVIPANKAAGIRQPTAVMLWQSFSSDGMRKLEEHRYTRVSKELPEERAFRDMFTTAVAQIPAPYKLISGRWIRVVPGRDYTRGCT
jgi:hypothetical protein